MPNPAQDNPITGAILTTRKHVHYTTTPTDREIHGLTQLCDGRTVTGAKRTTVGALTCQRCKAKAARHHWLMDGPSNPVPLVADMTIMIIQGFATGCVTKIEYVNSHMYHDPISGEITHIGDNVHVTLDHWGVRNFNADIVEPYA